MCRLYIGIIYRTERGALQTVANEPFAVNIFGVVVCPPLYINRSWFAIVQRGTGAIDTVR